MGVSAVGEGFSAASVKHLIATLVVVLALFYYFYGPPLTAMLSEAAHRECNELTGSSYRHYRLTWRTTTYESVVPPHWVCHDLRKPRAGGTDLGWWAGV